MGTPLALAGETISLPTLDPRSDRIIIVPLSATLLAIYEITE